MTELDDYGQLTDLADDLFCKCEERSQEYVCERCGKLVDFEEEE